MFQLIKLNFQIIWKRGRFLNYLMFLTFAASIISFLLYFGKSSSLFGNNMDSFFLLSGELNTFAVFFLYLLPLFVTYPEGDIGIIERKLYPQIYTKVKASKYHYAKAITVFLVGFAVMFYFLSLLYLFSYIMTSHTNTLFYTWSAIFPNNPSVTEVGFGLLLLNYPILQHFLYIFFICIYGGLMAVTSYVLSLFVRSKILSYAGPFFISVFIALGMNMIGGNLRNWYPQQVLNPMAPRLIVEGIFTLEFGIFVSFFVISLVLILLIRFKTMRIAKN
ncbi:MAG: hypothetical protein WBL80_01725 [Erysipelotrichaceae bacterium]